MTAHGVVLRGGEWIPASLVVSAVGNRDGGSSDGYFETHDGQNGMLPGEWATNYADGWDSDDADLGWVDEELVVRPRRAH